MPWPARGLHRVGVTCFFFSAPPLPPNINVGTEKLFVSVPRDLVRMRVQHWMEGERGTETPGENLMLSIGYCWGVRCFEELGWLVRDVSNTILARDVSHMTWRLLHTTHTRPHSGLLDCLKNLSDSFEMRRTLYDFLADGRHLADSREDTTWVLLLGLKNLLSPTRATLCLIMLVYGREPASDC